jgi:hypothetical protein
MSSTLALSLALMSLGSPSRPQPGLPELTLVQFDWGDVSSGDITPNTRMGAIRFHFTDDDTSLLRASGGRFVNVVLYNNATQGAEWVVRNLYLAYPDVDRMVGQDPEATFGVGLPGANGTAWTLSIFAYSLSEAPLASPINTHAQWQMPEHALYAKGGLAPDVAAFVSPPAPYDTIGPFDAFQGGGSSDIQCADICVPVSKLPKINELPNRCSPASVARSIAYMADQAGASLPQTPQQMSDTLAGFMQTGWVSGTTPDNMLDGKLDYTDEYELTICTSLVLGWEDNIEWVMERLKAGCDVEVLFPHHTAMLTGVMHGSAVSVITTVDDTNQFDFTASNDVHCNVVYPDGSCPSMGGVIRGFLVECWGMCGGSSDVAY